MDNKFGDKIYKIFYKGYTDFIKLPLLHKIFLIMLIIIFLYLVNKRVIFYEYYEDMTSGKKFESKFDNAIYDAFYSKYYDSIHLNKERDVGQLKIIVSYAKNKKFVKMLDIGCGTGYHVNMLNKMKYDVVGLDNSEHMINKAKSNYNNCEFVVGNILKNNLFDYNSFTHLLCLNKTIYHIKNKEKFFENCELLLTQDGLLIIHLVDRDKFKPFIIPKNDKSILYNPEHHNNNVSKSIIKINKNLEYLCEYELLENNNENTAYSCYNEKFENFETNNVRKNTINLYMPTIDEIIGIAKSKGFTIKDKKSLQTYGCPNEFLFILKKLS